MLSTHKFFSPVLLAALLALTPASLASDLKVSSSLDSSLNSVSAQSIAADIFFIASDELQGRDTPSAGLKIAARFIRARLAALGIEPGCDGSYFYEYSLDMARLDAEKTFAKLGGQELVEGVDYFGYFRVTEHLEVQGDMLWLGAETKEALEQGAVEGKWVVTRGKKTRSRSFGRMARKAGALGVIRLVSDTDEAPAELAISIKKTLSGSVTFPRSEGKQARTPKPAFPFLWMRESRMSELLGRSLVDLKLGTDLETVFQDKRVPDETTKQITVENVCGFWRGSDPELANEVIVISAHYDHIGLQGGEINNGADDNGSGTTGLMALAEALTTYGKLRRSVLVMWVSGEEKGLWGSKAWTLNPWLPEGCHAVANINIDMIGRNAADQLLVTPTREHEAYNGLTKLAERLAPLEGFPELGNADQYYQRSDHYNFRKNLDIPVAFLFSDIHDDYHRPTDTPEKIDTDKIRRVARLVMRMLDAMQDDVLEL